MFWNKQTAICFLHLPGWCFCQHTSVSFLEYIKSSYIAKSHALILPPTDINECELGVDTCHESATYSDVVGDAGSFSCTCNPGYTGNDTSCVGELRTVKSFSHWWYSCLGIMHRLWYYTITESTLSFAFFLLLSMISWSVNSGLPLLQGKRKEYGTIDTIPYNDSTCIGSTTNFYKQYLTL